MIDEPVFQKMLNGIASSDSAQRDEWAEAAAELAGSFAADQADVAARALARAALAETDDDLREAELNALTELITSHQIDRVTIGTVLAIDGSGLGSSEQEALADLRAYYNGNR